MQQMECEGNGGSEQPSSSNAAQSIALTTMSEKELEPMVLNIVERLMKSMVMNTLQPMVINSVRQVMQPVAEDLFRRVVKEERQAAEEKLKSGGSRVDSNDMVEERSLQLKFLDEVCGPVQTGRELKGVEDDPLKVALVDATGQIVTCGPESSAKVEILLLEANDNDLTHEHFERKIIGEEVKEKKPHFAKNVYVCLDKGVGCLVGLKLGHGKDWTKFCNCRLGARIVQNITGIIVQEAWTPPFKVIDKRAKQYGKHDNPFLSSDVWRLKRIARDGEPCKRLKNKNIRTVQDFRFWLSVHPEGLKQILCAGDSMWKTTVDHALTCRIDDEKIYSYKSPTEPQISVVYDSVGDLKGLIEEDHFVAIDNLSADKKDRARKLLISVLESAFEERYKTVFNNEPNSLLQEVPYGSSEINVSTNSSMQQTMEWGSSSQSINPSNLYDPGPSNSLGSKDMEMDYLNDDFVMDFLDRPPSPNPMFHYLDYVYSYNADQTYDGLGVDEGSVEPQAVETGVDPSNKLKRKMSLNHKKPKVG